MRALIQRVKEAKVEVNGEMKGQIGRGFLIFLGISDSDTEKDIDYLVDKISNLRVFEDKNGKFNLSLLDVQGEALVVSQFTLYADCTKGRRPSFIKAASLEIARDMYKKFVQKFRETKLGVEEGEFQAKMMVSLVNDGPVTIMVDSRQEAGIRNVMS